jgi:regulator of RNase E activity RraA
MTDHLKNIHQRLMNVDCASLCDASPLVRAFSPGLIPVHPQLKMVGRARPTSCSNDYLAVVKALSEAAEGEVLVIDGRGQTFAIFGQLLAADAKRRGLSGVIVDGSVRDVYGLRELKFPVFYRSTYPRAGRAENAEPQTEVISVCGVSVRTGDWLIGDADGIVVVPGAHSESIISVAEEIQRVEEKVFANVKKGESLTQIMKLEEFCREHESEIRAKLDFHVSDR